jgi:hypothetical protein
MVDPLGDIDVGHVQRILDEDITTSTRSSRGTSTRAPTPSAAATGTALAPRPRHSGCNTTHQKSKSEKLTRRGEAHVED